MEKNDRLTHIPVLVDEVLELLALEEGMTVVDATVGAGELSSRIAERIGEKGKLLGIDRDPRMLQVAGERLRAYPQVVLEQSTFSRLREVAAKHGLNKVDAIVADLGMSSIQLDDPKRGFSFRTSGPLDMRMDESESRRAADILNHADELALSELIYRYGEEKFSRRIARAIVSERPLQNTEQLAALVERVVPRGSGNRRRIHPATRTFQALRIVVNDELGELERVLPAAKDLLKDGGRLGVISFHSLEDRIVKHFFAEGERRGEWQRLTRKPVEPRPEEVAANSRSRSARLRVAQKVATST